MSIRIRSAWFGLVLAAVTASSASAQLQLAAVRGVVVDQNGAPVSGVTVDLADPLGGILETRSADASGRFTFATVAPGRYILRVTLNPWPPTNHPLTVEAALPVDTTLRLDLRTEVQVIIDEAIAPDTSATRASVGSESIAQVPIRSLARGLQDVVATLPGWATEDNGLLHVRGTDDGFLYVIDGIPVYERLDQLNGLGPDLETIESINVITGYIPAEFGYKAGGVIDIRSKALLSSWQGAGQFERGSEGSTAGTASASGQPSPQISLTFAASAQRTNRFLDPVHPDNLHNQGDVAGVSGQFTWLRSDANALSASLASGRMDYEVPNTESQEAASQDQRQRVSRNYGTVSWQHAWSSSTFSQLSGYVRRSTASLDGSPQDTPLFANARRQLNRTGAIGGLSRRIGAHTLKAGFEVQRLTLDESFLFAVTDDDGAEEAGLSDEAREYSLRRPFTFTGRSDPGMFSVFVQNDWTATDRLTLSGGVRFDESHVGIARRQLSPRVGFAYRIDRTVLRGSVSRFFQPPQPENLLLSSSEEARELSPFAPGGGEGGAAVEPERQWAFEAGLNHDFGGRFRFDAAVWHRSIVDAADPNVFAGTTIIFPNAVAEGRARGFDVRLELPRRRSWSGYFNLSVGRVRQHGPITGGLFLEDDVAEVASAGEFIPDHDQPIVSGAAVTWTHPRNGAAISATVRYESGTPIDRGGEDELGDRPGAELVDFDRGRVAPRTIASLLADVPIWKQGRRSARIRATIMNLFDDRYAYNFGNPFSGTHFGAPRTLSVAARLAF